MKNWGWVFFKIFRQGHVSHKGFWGKILMKRKASIAGKISKVIFVID
jgi:hypothetical protein